MPGPDGTGQVSGTCTIITTLPDHEAVPADAVRDACLTRWSASESLRSLPSTATAGRAGA
jgi:hypothetical protein